MFNNQSIKQQQSLTVKCATTDLQG